MIKQFAKTAARWGIARKTTNGGLLATGVGFLATKVATRSIPGALLVGGAILGKHLWDRKKAKDAVAAPTTDHDALASAEASARRKLSGNEPSQIREIGRVN